MQKNKQMHWEVFIVSYLFCIKLDKIHHLQAYISQKNIYHSQKWLKWQALTENRGTLSDLITWTIKHGGLEHAFEFRTNAAYKQLVSDSMDVTEFK